MTDAPRNALVVEDNPDDEELTIRGLAHAKLKNRVDVARDGQEAIDYLLGSEKHAARPLPAVVLLKLAKVGSLEILRRMRAENGTHRPVVTLTSSNEHTDVVNGYDAGANSYVCSRAGATPSPLQ